MKMKLSSFAVLLAIILQGCSAYDNDKLQTDYEEINKEKQYNAEENDRIQQKQDTISDENTNMDHTTKTGNSENESVNYQDYSGFWTEGGISHEELLRNGGVEFYIEIINGNELKGYLYAQQGITERIAEVEDILCIVQDGECQYSFSNDGWGGSGTLHIRFGQNEVVIEVKDYMLNETNVIGFGIDRTYVLTRVQSTNVPETESELSIFESQTEALEQYKPDWTEEQISKEFNKRIKYSENCEFYEEVLYYMEAVREVTDISIFTEPLYATDTNYYSKEDFRNDPPLIIYLAKNEIYARHGYIFKDENLNNYFKRNLWYVPSVNAEEFDDTVFNEYERENLKLLVELLQ